jgi:predicted AlkP superfamily phosphohydrolase/phosphomutase
MFEQYRHVLGAFERGLLFYYMGSADQVSHMLWDSLDPQHPQYDPEVHPAFADVIPSIYARLDEMIGLTLEKLRPEDTLVVMSDHGFTSWTRTFNLNAWLAENGYLVLGNPERRAAKGFFSGVDWSKSRAYGLGINGLYLNLAGREKNGVVAPGDRLALMREIHDKLLQVVDPATGGPAITKVYLRDEAFRDRGHEEVGPDLVIGYAKGTRCSGDSSIGGIADEVFEDNTDDWPGDHLMDHETVPGILATNRPLARPVANLRELAPAILAGFGVEGFPAAQTQ